MLSEQIIRFLKDIRDRPNFRGCLLDLVRQIVALCWMDAFRDEYEQKDEIPPAWVFAWSVTYPSAAESPVFEEGDDLAPGVGTPPPKISETTPPRRTLIDRWMQEDPEFRAEFTAAIKH